MSAVTKEGVTVRAGQVWRDLDKRMNGRMRSVIAVVDDKAVMCGVGTSNHSTTKVAISRMHKTSTGWALVSEAP